LARLFFSAAITPPRAAGLDGRVYLLREPARFRARLALTALRGLALAEARDLGLEAVRDLRFDLRLEELRGFDLR
jgi:hypothetical protein